MAILRTHPYCWTVGHPHPWIANRVPGKGMSKMVSHMNPKDLLSLTKNPLKCRLPSYLKEILSLSFSLPTMEIHLSFQALPISFLPRFFFPECSLDIEILLKSKSLPSDWACENSPWEDASGTDEFHSSWPLYWLLLFHPLLVQQILPPPPSHRCQNTSYCLSHS